MPESEPKGLRTVKILQQIRGQKPVKLNRNATRLGQLMRPLFSDLAEKWSFKRINLKIKNYPRPVVGSHQF